MYIYLFVVKFIDGGTLHWKKKWSHFDLKSWVTGGTKIRHGIPSNLTQIFSNYLESRVKFYFHQWLNFSGQNDSIFSFSDTML